MALESVKDFYYSLEEGWYNFWDKVDAHIPVNGVIDAVDAVIPSMILFILIVLLLVVFGAYFVMSSAQVYSASFVISTPDNLPVYDTQITAQLMDGANFVKSLEGRTDSEGRITFEKIRGGQEIIFDINLSRGTYSGTFTVMDNIDETIKLIAPAVSFQAAKKTIYVKTLAGITPSTNIPITFSCTNPSIIPSPASATFSGNPIDVVEPAGCMLQATVNSSKYKQKTYLVNSTSYDLYLENAEPTGAKVTVRIRYNNFPVSDSSFSVKLNGANTYQADTALTSEVVFNAVEPGDYTLSISDNSNKYGITSKSITVPTTGTEQIIAVTKTVKARVSVKIVDASTNLALEGAIVKAKDPLIYTELDSKETDASGYAEFAFTDLGDYVFSAKRLGDLNGGYFVKEITQTVLGDTNFVIGLERITTLNAGRTRIKVTDQDGAPVINAKVMLKYSSNDGIVELLQSKNYAMTDANGETRLIAGKITGQVYAYAIKGPFFGKSDDKTIQLDGENSIIVQLELGTAIMKINVQDELGNNIDGTAEIFTTEGLQSDSHGIAGLISVEKGVAVKTVKAGQSVYVKVRAETFEDYYTVPTMLWPNKTYEVDVVMKKQILEPEVKLVNESIYNEAGQQVQTLAPGKKYYAKFILNSDAAYSQMMLNFRAGKEALMENDVVEIDSVEGANIYTETRGVTYDPAQGYSYDGDYLTDGPSKWINVLWQNAGKGTREVRVWFRVKGDASMNREVVFYYRAKFGADKRVPQSNAEQEFYSDTYSTITYFIGQEAVCEPGNDFCVNAEWLYSQSDELYQQKPYEMLQIVPYTYHFSLLNNSGIDYGNTGTKKPAYLSITIVGDEQEEKRLKMNEYQIKDGVSTTSNTTGKAVFKVENVPIASFEKNSTIDVRLALEALKFGAETIKFELKSEGQIVFSKETDIAVVQQKDFTVTIDPNFIPALLNTQLTVNAVDEKGEVMPDAKVTVFAKEIGYDEFVVDSDHTDRLGNVTVNSGALFQGSKVRIEVLKEGYSRKNFVITVSEAAIVTDPRELFVELNTISRREETKSIIFGNMTTKDMVMKRITMDAKLKDVINEDAMNAYFEEMLTQDKTIKGEDTLEVDFLKIRLMNNITQDGFIEPIHIKGNITATFEQPETHLIYSVKIPLTLDVSSEANVGADCLVIKPYNTNTVTDRAQSTFNFEIQNACASDGKDVSLDALTVTSDAEIPGIAEISLRSAGGTSIGRTALDGGKRVILNKVDAGEKLFGTLTFAPEANAAGKSVPIRVTFEAKFQGMTIKSNPGTVTFTTNVINLKECLSIEQDTSPIDFYGKAKVKIDASNCLGQTVYIQICKNDPGCSGGTSEGRVSVSSGVGVAFSVKSTKEITISGPSLPGTYGVKVSARTNLQLGWTYIGEFPVTFKERTGQYFQLNKFELDLKGIGAQDQILLTNKALTQSVKVKANECVWGKKDGEFSWSNALTGAMLGAAIGSMVSSSIPKSSKTSYAGSVPGGTTTTTPAQKPVVKPEVDPTGLKIYKVYDATPYDNSLTPVKLFFEAVTAPERAIFSAIDEKAKSANFGLPVTGTSTTTTGNWWGAGITVAFAVIGGYLMGQSDYKCADHYQTVGYTDFFILLQGTTVSVTPPDNSSTSAEQTVPPDAGDLAFTLSDVSADWNFDDASYGSDEMVTMNFTNNGLDDSAARYGVLTVNSTEHLHGNNVVNLTSDTGTDTSSSASYDVFCDAATFGNYWIGAGGNEGSCSGIISKNYKQKYHLRVVSADTNGEEAYIKKASSCYFGALTGSTGADALPKVKLDWEWDHINSDACDYANPDHIYCDATQFTIALTKKLAILDTFLAQNDNKFTCPPNPGEVSVEDMLSSVNTDPIIATPFGFIGIKSAEISILNDVATARVTVINNTGGPADASVSAGWSGNGGTSLNNTETRQMTFAAGETIVEFSASTPKYEGMYEFMTTINGEKSFFTQVRRAFTNRLTSASAACWVPQTTRKYAGLPGVVYYAASTPNVVYGDIKDTQDLYNAVEFGVYLTKDAFSDDFLNDFKDYYANKILTGARAGTEKDIVNYLASGNFKVKKKFSGENTVEAGLYDVWINIDANNHFRVIDGNSTKIEVNLILIKRPSISSPFYNMPFDGLVGATGGRQGYGSVYTNTSENDVEVSTVIGTRTNTFYNAASNGVVSIRTSTSTSFDALNTAIDTRARIASISASDDTGQIILTPNYATPVILKSVVNETVGRIAYELDNRNAVSTGGNMSYWTGAAKSKDFFGGNAVETYTDSPDNRLYKVGDNYYGFEFKDLTRKGTMYLKSVFFTPVDSSLYNIVSKVDGTSFWTPSTEFGVSARLGGIPGMQFNSKTEDSYIRSLQNLFTAVENEEVCLSSDGTDTIFWWNPKTIAKTVGTSYSLDTKEIALVGTS
ncbi:Uncharacterised protein [uncultured archaeon]|nr:Uncharacterised protein [uncultured archaeon]